MQEAADDFLQSEEGQKVGRWSEAKIKYMDTDIRDLNPADIKTIMDELTILSPRESMVWFINEIFDCLMADFDWDKTVYFAQFVYKTLCHIH